VKAITVKAIVAADDDWVIGYQNKLPWHVPEDLKRFSQLTRGNTVLMGRATFDSLPAKFKPLPGRLNVVISRSLSSPSDNSFLVFRSPEEAFNALQGEGLTLPSNVVWVVGGEQIYKATRPLWEELFVTRVKGSHKGDAHFPAPGPEFELVESEDYPTHSFQRFSRKG
jgi:dihydrofolate reductase